MDLSTETDFRARALRLSRLVLRCCIEHVSAHRASFLERLSFSHAAGCEPMHRGLYLRLGRKFSVQKEW